MKKQKNKIEMFDLLKIDMRMIKEAKFDLSMKDNEEIPYLVRQPDSPLFRQLEILRGKKVHKISELILIKARYIKKDEGNNKCFNKLLGEGFQFNHRHYRRFGKSASQAKQGITVFIDDGYYERMMERSQLGVKVDKCVISKYESQRCLIFSSCRMVNERIPNIVIVGEYTKTLHHQHIRCVQEEPAEFEGHKYLRRSIVEKKDTDLEISPFDGFGVHTKEISKMFSKYLPNEHQSVLFQIRLPYMKGVSVEFPFKQYFRDHNITHITDIFGTDHDIENIDCIWNTSMWKGYKIFNERFGENAWKEYINRINKYGFQLGVSKFNHNVDEVNLYSRLNFQYLQCLNLINPKYIGKWKDHDYTYDILDNRNDGKIIELARYSTNLFDKIISGDKLYVLKFLGVTDTDNIKDDDSNYIKAILLNNRMLQDPPIRKMLKRKLDKAINEMKFGKIYARGFYHIVIGDVIGYLQYCSGLTGANIKGCLKAGEFYTNSFKIGEACLSMRSPLVDPSEVNKVKINLDYHYQDYFHHLDGTDIVMINMHDISMQQQGGMDEDGDLVFLTNEPILVNSKIDMPIVVDVDDKHPAEKVEYNHNNLIEYEKHSRDSRIGEITNIATSILNSYTEELKYIKRNQNRVALLRLNQGKEIDYLKTGFRWNIPSFRKHFKWLPYFLLYNYPNKLKAYRKKMSNKDYKNLKAYKSPSQLNELCEYICTWERQLVWNKTMRNNSKLVVDHQLDLSDKDIMKKIKQITEQFGVDFRRCLDEDKDVDVLLEKYNNKLHKIFADEDELLANYVIKVSYKAMNNDKLLCWMLFGEYILKNLEKNSKTKKQPSYKIVETIKDDENASEFLGRYYTLIEKDDK